jgi:nicotinamidase-related amidase
MRSALLVVDMLNDFVDGVLANPAAAGIVEPIQRLATRARTTPDWVVVYANDAHQLSDVELRVFPPHAMAGTPGAAVVGELRPEQGDVVVPKRFYSSFTSSTLEGELRARDVGRVVLVGQHTDCCVRHTAYDAFIRGFEVAVCPDATAVFEPGSAEPVPARQARALEYLRTYYGARLVPAEDVA